jgi:hypothetical protein
MTIDVPSADPTHRLHTGSDPDLTQGDPSVLRRGALVVAKDLAPGETANVAAVVMGQLAILCPTLYADDDLADRDGISHAAIRSSVVVLSARRGQLSTLAATARTVPEVTATSFTRLGQSLHNAYGDYAAQIRESSGHDLSAVGVFGDDSVIRSLTRKFSVLR